MPASTPTIVVFDTDCILCSHWVRFVLKHDRAGTIQFASSRKTTGQKIAAEFGLSPDQLDLTYLVVRDGALFLKSEATLALLADLRAPWCYLQILRFVPRGLRDGVYDIVARNRLRWFGTRKDCLLPTPQERDRFLD